MNLSSDDMRALGYRVIDLLVEHYERLPDLSPARTADRATLRALLDEPMPETGTDPFEVLRRAERDVLGYNMAPHHPRFFAFVPSPSNFVSVMADTLAAGFNVFAGVWMEGAGAAQVELTTLDWLRTSCGLPETTGGLFVSGGSMANITALAVARHVQLNDDSTGAVAYCADQTHSAVARGLRVLGFAPEQVRRLPPDDRFRLEVAVVREAVARDRADGRRPFCVIANAGTTNTGAVDPLPDLAAFCRSEGLWLHVDGAYGAAAVLSERGRALLAGLDQADSLALDPHKWLFQPFEIGCVLVRERRWLYDTFHILPEYLKDVAGTEEEVNFSDHGLQLTRSFRALKLWMSLTVFGRTAFAAAIDRGIDLAERVEALVRERPGWAVVTPAQLGVVTFRCVGTGDAPVDANAFHHRLVADLLADGFAMITTTELHGETVLRMCTINPRTTEADLEATLDRLDHLRRRLLGETE